MRFQRACEDIELHHQEELQELKQHLAMALTSFQVQSSPPQPSQPPTQHSPLLPVLSNFTSVPLASLFIYPFFLR